MTDQKDAVVRPGPAGPEGSPSAEPALRSKFGAASEGWEAYNSWLDRVRQQPGP